MNTYTQKFKIRLGLFVLGGMILFILAIFIIGKQKNLFNPVYRLTTTFYNVSGLQVGNNVRFSGINVGTVDVISIINDTAVRVDMLVRKNVKQFIKTDSKVGIGSDGLIGDRMLVISQGSTDMPTATDGYELASTEPLETDAIMRSLERTTGSVEVITEELAMVMMKMNSGRGTLGRLIHDSLIAQNIMQTVENLKNTSEGIDETLDTIAQGVVTLLRSLKVSAVHLESTTKEISQITHGINHGNGPISLLIKDTTVAKNLDETVLNLKKSSISLDQNLEALKQTWLLRGYFKKKAKSGEADRYEVNKTSDDGPVPPDALMP